MFDSKDYLPDSVVAKITDVRINDPDCGWRSAQARVRRERVGGSSGKLNLVAADHPARGVAKVGDNPLAMADRRDYLARIVRVLTADGIDGVMATMDILEDLLILDAGFRAAGAMPLLDNKVLIASLNRGGLAGSVWELDDPVTGPGPVACANWRLDGIKALLRVSNDDAGSLRTIVACAQAINECNALGLPMFLEPLPVAKTAAGWSVQKNKEALAKLAGVASALGDSSRYLWLKLPYCEGYETVARSTTLPILLLGGESAGNPEPFLKEMAGALRAGSNVRGALVGRNVLYPGDEDPLAMACAVGGIVHQSWTIEQAMESFAANRGRDTRRISETWQTPRAV